LAGCGGIGRLQRGWLLYQQCKAERLVPCTVVLVHALALARRAENWSWVKQASDALMRVCA
jgi:hypothetical protein